MSPVGGIIGGLLGLVVGLWIWHRWLRLKSPPRWPRIEGAEVAAEIRRCMALPKPSLRHVGLEALAHRLDHADVWVLMPRDVLDD